MRPPTGAVRIWVAESLADASPAVWNRSVTLAQLAAFNALNAITPRYHAYHAAPAADPSASPEAALLTDSARESPNRWERSPGVLNSP